MSDNKETSPLLDEYIQKQKQNQKFDTIDESEIAKAIKTLLKSSDDLPKDLN